MSMFKYAAPGFAGTAEQGPASRAALLRDYVASQGLEMESIYYSAGEWDMVMVIKGELSASILANNWRALGSGAFAESVSFQVFDPEEFQAGFDEAEIGNWLPPGSD